MNPMSRRSALAAALTLLRKSSMSFLFVLFAKVIFAQPTISNFSPASGPVGTSVTINGSGFSATAGNNIVLFGQVKATVISATATQLVVRVPANAGTVPFTVTAGGLTAFSAKPFMAGFPGMDAVTASGITNSSARGGITQYWYTNKTALAPTDLNADGKPELMVGMDNGKMSQYDNSSSPGQILLSRAFIDIDAGTSQFPVSDIISGDLDGDGIPEILAADEYNDQLTIFNSSMSSLITLGIRGGPNSLVIADMDKDGKPDIVVGCDRISSIRIFRNTSTTGMLSFASTTISTNGFMAKLAVRDIDGDSKPDIAGIIPDNNGSNPIHKVGLLRNTSPAPGTVSFSISTFTVGIRPGHIQLDDLDGDDKPDMVVSFPSAPKVTVYQNQSLGNISFSTGIDFSTTGTTGAIVIADIDGDAKPEIVAGNAAGSSVDVLKNNSVLGAFNFSLVNIASSFSSDYVVVNDFDGDGKNDIAIASASTSGMEVLRNIISEPVIASITPNGTAEGGIVTIEGSYLSTATEVSFGGTPASSFTINPDGSITAVAGTGSSGSVVVNTPFGTARYCCFTYYRPPSITSFSPTEAATGARVTISGTNLTGATRVTFGGVQASFTVNGSGTSITATVGAGASGTVEVFHPAGDVSKTGFTYLPPPTITSFSPTSGKTGDQIIITGTNFTNHLSQGIVTGVSLGGVAVSSRSYISATQIRVTVGSGASGDVKVSTWNGSTVLAGFTYLPAPTITSFTPTEGSQNDVITITGTNFTGATAVSFGGTAATSFIVVDANTITAIIAEGTTGDISVTAPGGTATLAGFTYVPPAPAITSFTPTTGIAGDVITITGTNFTGATIVSFGGTAASSFTVVDATTITATVADGASGNVLVATPKGTASIAGFTYIHAPVITSFTPTSAAGGQTVTITGNNFTNASAVSFGGTAATSFNVVDATTITAIVGTGASGNVSVTTPGGTVTLAGFAFIPAPVITSFTPTSAAGGQTVTITGNNFTNASAISFGGTAATSFNVVDATTITAIVGAGASGNVSVTTPGGTATLPGFSYTPITAISTPVIVGISPSTAGTGETVTITGINLGNAVSVTLGGTPVQSYTVVSATTIVAVVGAGSSGNVSVITPVDTAMLAGFIFRQSSDDMVIYPNPVDNRMMFWVKHPELASDVWINVFDNTGKVIKTVPARAGTTVTRVYVGDLKSGYYHVVLLGAAHKQVKTLVVW